MFFLRPGSVVASFIIIYLTNDVNATWPLKQAVAKGKLADFSVDKSSLKITDGEDNPLNCLSSIGTVFNGYSMHGSLMMVIPYLLLTKEPMLLSLHTILQIPVTSQS